MTCSLPPRYHGRQSGLALWLRHTHATRQKSRCRERHQFGSRRPLLAFTITAVPGTESYPIRVTSESGDQQWTLTTSRRGRGWLIAVTDHDGNSWAAEGPDLFEALRALRSAVDPLGIRLGVNGARRDAWASGMQRDMGEGRFVYLLTEGETGRPPQVSTLGRASLAEVGTVREQEEQHARWLSSRRGIQ